MSTNACRWARPRACLVQTSLPAVRRSQACSRHDVPCQRQLLGALAAAIVVGSPCGAHALGLESIDLPGAPQASEQAKRIADRNSKILADAEAEFQNSDLLSILKRNSEDNREANAKAIEKKYCQRQAEMGVGDCGGLQLIPGATRNGLQRTPDWLAKILGIEQEPALEFDFFKD